MKKKVISNIKPDNQETIGRKILANFNIKEVSKTDEDGNVNSHWEYDQIKFPIGTPQHYIDEQVKDATLGRLKVEVSSGKVFYADPISRTDLLTAIIEAVETGETSTTWKLAEDFNGSRCATVTVDELKEARRLALTIKGQVVGAI